MNSTADPRPAGAPHGAIHLPWAWIIVTAIIIAMFYPGVMSNDSLASLKQARTLEFTSWHPPIMALIWSVLDHLVRGPALMLVAQAMLYAAAASKLCVEAFPALMRQFPRALVVLPFALFPPVLALNGMIWKDVWMSALLLLALAYLFRMASAVDRKSRLGAFVMVVLASLFATAFRHNAIAATAGLLAGACYFLWPDRLIALRLLASCMMGVLLAGMLVLLVSTATRLIAKPAHVTTPILMHDIAGIIVESGEPAVAGRYALSLAPGLSDKPKRFVRDIKRTYTPAAAGPILRTSRRPDAPFAINVYDLDHDAASVKRAWLGMVKRYPGAYLRHRSHAFACLLQLCGTEGWAKHSYVLNPAYVDVEGSNPMQSVLRRLFLSPAWVRIYAPAFWLVVVLLGGAIGLARIRSRPGLLIFMVLSAVGLAVSLFFTSPIESYRYMHWIILTGWTAVWMALDALIGEHAAILPWHRTLHPPRVD
jgi:hypothetical protein